MSSGKETMQDASLRGVGVERGGEEPALNVQDKRPAGLVRDHSSSSSSHTSSGSATGSQHQSLASSAVGKCGKGGGTPATNQRTEVTTSSSGGPMMSILQGAVTVPTGAHSTVHEHTDVMKQKMDSHTKSETHVVSVPVTSSESSNMESVRTSYTEDKALTVAAPIPIPEILSNLQVEGGANPILQAGTTMDLTTVQRNDLGPEEYAIYKTEVEASARDYEKDADKRASDHRAEVERDAEWIKQCSERQHVRDLEFKRKEIKHQVDREGRDTQLKAKYAMRALELGELKCNAAREALETDKEGQT